MMKKIVTILFIIILIITKINAQITITDSIPVYIETPFVKLENTHQLTVKAGYFIPLNGTKSFISDKKIIAPIFDYDYSLKNNYSFGVELIFLNFSKTLDRQTYDFGGTLVSATNKRHLNLLSLMPHATYYFKPIDKAIRPFIALGLGVSKISYSNFYGYYEDVKNRTRPVINPSLGARFSLNHQYFIIMDARISARYSPFSYDFIKNASYVSIDLGIGIRWFEEK